MAMRDELILCAATLLPDPVRPDAASLELEVEAAQREVAALRGQVAAAQATARQSMARRDAILSSRSLSGANDALKQGVAAADPFLGHVHRPGRRG